MGRSKRGPSLFEVLSREDGAGVDVPKVPNWWARGDDDVMAPAGEAGSARSPSEPPADVESRRGEAGGTRPMFVLDGERLRVSLTSTTAAVTLFAAVVVLLGTFEVGRRIGNQAAFKHGFSAGRASYEAEAMSEIEAARQQPAATQVVAGLFEDALNDGSTADLASQDTSTDERRPGWIRDYTYVVAQEFAAGREESAKQAQDFLAEHGVATELVRYSSGAVQLITTQGYNHRDPLQRQMADQLLRKVRDLGAQYFAAGGGYRLDGYFKSLKGDTW